LPFTSRASSTRLARNIAAFVTAVVPASLAAQQSQTGALQGSVAEAIGGHPVADATVELARVRPEPVVTVTARPDAKGRYRIDSLLPGEYVARLTTPLLDSLELALPERAVSIVSSATARVDFTVPRGATLRDAVCAGLTLGKAKAVVAGHALDADTDQPLAGANLVVTWTELVVDSSLGARSQEFSAAVQTGERGEYRLCGVPADTRLSLQLQHAGRASAAVEVTVTSEAGAVVRDLSLSARNAPTLTAIDSVEHARGDTADVAEAMLLTGSAAISGIVRGATGLPLENTEVRVRGARSKSVSDAAGRFSLSALPAGTQVLLARHIGYEPTEVAVELREGRKVQHDLKLTRAILLDSLRVVAMRSQYPEFEYNRRANPFGRYLGPDEVERRHATSAMGLLFGIPGLAGVGHNVNEKVVSTHAARRCKSMRIYLDGTEVDDAIDSIQASQIGAVEVYVDGAFVPSRYAARGGCGVVVFWSKSSRRITSPAAAPAPEAP
jgi:hypothetical protein